MTQQNNGNTGNRGMGSTDKDKIKDKQRDDSQQSNRADHMGEGSREFDASQNPGNAEKSGMDRDQDRSHMSERTPQDDQARDGYREER